jgi:hypothetical protein
VTVVSSAFEQLARVEAHALGAGGLPLLVVPHPVGSRPTEELEALGADLVQGCFGALTVTEPR